MKKILPAIAATIALTASAAEMPEFPGGSEAMTEYITQNIMYPPRAADNGIEGVVHIGCIVKADGSISAVKVLRPLDPDLEREAVRIVQSMPAWIPRQEDGKPVDAPVNIEVVFELPE